MTAAPAVLTLLSAGMQTLVVDHGRPRSRSLGVPVGGAADRFSLAIGNALVGNPPDAAALEISLVGPTLQSDAPLACVLYGAPFEMRSDRQALTAGTTFTLQAGERLTIGGTPRRMRAYLCVRGGLGTPIVLGSRSSLVPLQAFEWFACQLATIQGRRVEIDPDSAPSVPTFRILPGAQANWFADSGLASSLGQGPALTFEVTPASNRMGLRLRGVPLSVPSRELVSEPVCPGTIQVTRDGQCIILGVDGQTIGGYPKIAHVIGADLDRLGQLRPGERIAFEYVDLAFAERLYRQRSEQLREWLTRLKVVA